MTPDTAIIIGIVGLSICFSLMYLIHKIPNSREVKS